MALYSLFNAAPSGRTLLLLSRKLFARPALMRSLDCGSKIFLVQTKEPQKEGALGLCAVRVHTELFISCVSEADLVEPA